MCLGQDAVAVEDVEVDETEVANVAALDVVAVATGLADGEKLDWSVC